MMILALVLFIINSFTINYVYKCFDNIYSELYTGFYTNPSTDSIPRTNYINSLRNKFFAGTNNFPTQSYTQFYL